MDKEISLLLEEYKAENIISLDVKNKSSVTDTMIIASGRSTRHVKSISDNIIKKLKKVKIKPLGIEGYSKSEWVLIDFGDVLVHVMHPEAREFYSLEKLWDESLNNEQMKEYFLPLIMIASCLVTPASAQVFRGGGSSGTDCPSGSQYKGNEFYKSKSTNNFFVVVDLAEHLALLELNTRGMCSAEGTNFLH